MEIRPMRKISSWAKRGLVMMAPLPLVFAIGANAAGPSDNASPALRAAMMRDLGMTSAQVSQYLKVERLAGQQESLQARVQGDRYAGSWIERGADGNSRFVVATTRIGPQV